MALGTGGRIATYFGMLFVRIPQKVSSRFENARLIVARRSAASASQAGHTIWSSVPVASRPIGPKTIGPAGFSIEQGFLV
jgi:hypothetical protein